MSKENNKFNALLRVGEVLVTIDEDLSFSTILENSVGEGDCGCRSVEVVLNYGGAFFEDVVYFSEEKPQDLLTHINFFRAFQKKNKMSAKQFLSFLYEYREVTETNPFNTLFTNVNEFKFRGIYTSKKELEIGIFFNDVLSKEIESLPENLMGIIEEFRVNTSIIAPDYYYVVYDWWQNGDTFYSYIKIPQGLNYNNNEDYEKMLSYINEN